MRQRGLLVEDLEGQHGDDGSLGEHALWRCIGGAAEADAGERDGAIQGYDPVHPHDDLQHMTSNDGGKLHGSDSRDMERRLPDVTVIMDGRELAEWRR